MSNEPTVFNGRYELHRRIGRGGMAEVSLARDQLLDRPVAIKVLFPEFATDPAFVERFRREATAAANLNHPNVVGVYDWGEAEGTYFIVMEYVDGRSLSQILRAEGPLHPDRVADVGADVASALGFAHRNGVVHRDVKPGNVLVDQGGLVKVADFGIARAITASTDENLTQVGTVMGTATYFSPEQARGDAVDPRSDIYSLGCVLYELVVGRPPFTGESPVAIAYKQVHEAPVPPRQVNSAVPPALEAIILKCLAKNPANRYPSAEDLRADLRRFREGSRILAEPVMAPPTRDPAATGVLAATTAVAAAPRTRAGMPAYVEQDWEDEPRRNSGTFLAVLVILLLLLAGMLFLLARTLGLGDDDDGVAQREVPRVIGEPVDDARQTLEALGFVVDELPEPNDEFEEGEVFAQSPEGGTQVDEGSTVTLRVSAGGELATVPGVIGKQLEEAQAEIEAAGFRVRVESREDDDAEENEVVDQDPAPQTEATTNSEVTLFVNTGPGQVEIRDVRGRTEADATSLLEDDGFVVTVTEEASADIADGRVIRTDPPAGASRPEGATITLVVSSGPQQQNKPVPGVVGLSEANATQVLESNGFVVDIQEQEVIAPTDDGRVVSQSPGPGSSRPEGSTVTITVGRLVAPDDDGGE
ncbi:MAG TPA: Stk1 family PASTA domain-containing Ser/Thr kinase [Acidimicrobiales bacterium]|nr:Stk1 family PASTA domain-containing Ser/Thr kinase [Acidimicrobiales bacterium]